MPSKISKYGLLALDVGSRRCDSTSVGMEASSLSRSRQSLLVTTKDVIRNACRHASVDDEERGRGLDLCDRGEAPITLVIRKLGKGSTKRYCLPVSCLPSVKLLRGTSMGNS
jgi:hypothetical protein